MGVTPMEKKLQLQSSTSLASLSTVHRIRDIGGRDKCLADPKTETEEEQN